MIFFNDLSRSKDKAMFEYKGMYIKDFYQLFIINSDMSITQIFNKEDYYLPISAEKSTEIEI